MTHLRRFATWLLNLARTADYLMRLEARVAELEAWRDEVAARETEQQVHRMRERDL